ncbi:hypothetical protein GQ44DRAFT_559984, partial [Phaeosphaeriaceae sp. PMI808]
PSAEVDQELDDLLHMIRPQRQNLLKGPEVTVFIGSAAIAGIYKRVAMAASRVLNVHFTKNPESLEYHFGQGSLAPAAVQFLLVTWPQDISDKFEAHAVRMFNTFDKNIALLRASRMLGMAPYTKHILRSYIDYLKTSLPSYEEITMVEKNAVSNKDPLFTNMVNHLCHDRHKKLIPDPEVFAKYPEKHSRLRLAMESTDKYFAGEAKKRWEAGQAKWQAKEDEKRVLWEKAKAEKRMRILEEK